MRPGRKEGIFYMGQIKTVRKITLPLIVGQPVCFIREDGAVCQTRPKVIDGIVCREKGLEVTFTTSNSTYRGIVPIVSPLPEYVPGQEIAAGQDVVSTSNEYETITGILEVREDGIIAETRSGIFRGLVRLM